MRAAHYAARGAPANIELPLLEDAYAVQSGLQQVLQAVASDQLDSKRAGLLLYGLQLASANLDRITALQPAATADDEACEAYPEYEQEFELGEHARPVPSAEELAVVAARRQLKMVFGALKAKTKYRERHAISVDRKEMVGEYWECQNAMRALDFALAALRDREAQGSEASAYSAPPRDSTRPQAALPDDGYETFTGAPYPARDEVERVPKNWRPAMTAIKRHFAAAEARREREAEAAQSQTPHTGLPLPRNGKQVLVAHDFALK